MIGKDDQIRIYCMFEAINRGRSSTSNKFGYIIKQFDSTPHEAAIGSHSAIGKRVGL